MGTFGPAQAGGSVQHRISGTVSFPNPNTVMINDFNYDGNGVCESNTNLL